MTFWAAKKSFYRGTFRLSRFRLHHSVDSLFLDLVVSVPVPLLMFSLVCYYLLSLSKHKLNKECVRERFWAHLCKSCALKCASMLSRVCLYMVHYVLRMKASDYHSLNMFCMAMIFFYTSLLLVVTVLVAGWWLFNFLPTFHLHSARK